jgi:hypothetical protein
MISGLSLMKKLKVESYCQAIKEGEYNPEKLN